MFSFLFVSTFLFPFSRPLDFVRFCYVCRSSISRIGLFVYVSLMWISLSLALSLCEIAQRELETCLGVTAQSPCEYPSRVSREGITFLFSFSFLSFSLCRACFWYVVPSLSGSKYLSPFKSLAPSSLERERTMLCIACSRRGSPRDVSIAGAFRGPFEFRQNSDFSRGKLSYTEIGEFLFFGCFFSHFFIKCQFWSFFDVLFL